MKNIVSKGKHTGRKKKAHFTACGANESTPVSNVKIWVLYLAQPTCDERLVGHGMSFNDPPVDWKLPSRNNFYYIAPLNQLHIHLLLTAPHGNIKRRRHCTS